MQRERKRGRSRHSILLFLSSYLGCQRSRDAKKDFVDWGNEAITSTDKMTALEYDEITSIAHAEFRIAKECE